MNVHGKCQLVDPVSSEKHQAPAQRQKRTQLRCVARRPRWRCVLEMASSCGALTKFKATRKAEASAFCLLNKRRCRSWRRARIEWGNAGTPCASRTKSDRVHRLIRKEEDQRAKNPAPGPDCSPPKPPTCYTVLHPATPRRGDKPVRGSMLVCSCKNTETATPSATNEKQPGFADLLAPLFHHHQSSLLNNWLKGNNPRDNTLGK